MGNLVSEIDQIEKAVNTLVRRPRLIRREYRVSEIEDVLERPAFRRAIDSACRHF
jgi:hypothetical protein